jgi:TusA-related sulfurtransferase
MPEYSIDESIDITDAVCPVTFVRAKVARDTKS